MESGLVSRLRAEIENWGDVTDTAREPLLSKAADLLELYEAELVAHNCGTPGCLCYALCREADAIRSQDKGKE